MDSYLGAARLSRYTGHMIQARPIHDRSSTTEIVASPAFGHHGVSVVEGFGLFYLEVDSCSLMPEVELLLFVSCRLF